MTNLISSVVISSVLFCFGSFAYFIPFFYYYTICHSLWFCFGCVHRRMLKLYNRSTQKLIAKNPWFSIFFLSLSLFNETTVLCDQERLRVIQFESFRTVDWWLSLQLLVNYTCTRCNYCEIDYHKICSYICPSAPRRQPWIEENLDKTFFFPPPTT